MKLNENGISDADVPKDRSWALPSEPDGIDSNQINKKLEHFGSTM